LTCQTGFEAGLSFCRSGQNTAGIPVICLHGIGSDHSGFAAQHNHLGSRPVIAWDMPGYGASLSVAKMDFVTLAESVTRLMDALLIDRAHLVGQSIGGMIAQEVAIRDPARVVSLGLIATTSAFGGPDDSFRDAFLKARLAPLDAGADMACLARDAIPEILGPAAGPAVRDAAIAAMAGIDEAAYRQVLSCLITFNRRTDLHFISQPCCLIAGSHDLNSPARIMAKMADRLGDATFHVVDQAGHLVNSEQPEMVNVLLNSLFERAEIG